MLRGPRFGAGKRGPYQMKRLLRAGRH